MSMCTIYNKVLITLLKVLGFSTPFAFMACYGPPPSAGMAPVDMEQVEEVVAEEDSIDIVDTAIGDSTTCNSNN